MGEWTHQDGALYNLFIILETDIPEGIDNFIVIGYNISIIQFFWLGPTCRLPPGRPTLLSPRTSRPNIHTTKGVINRS